MPYPRSQKALDPLYECKTDLEIMRLVTAKMGMDIYPKSDDDFLKEVIDTEANVKRARSKSLRRASWFAMLLTPIRVWCEVQRRGATFEVLPRSPRRATTSGGRSPIASVCLITKHADRAYEENPLRDEVSAVRMQRGTANYHVHSQLAYTPVMRELEPRAVAEGQRDRCRRARNPAGRLRARHNDHGYAVTQGAM